MKKTYNELIQIPDFDGRLEYLRLHGSVGRETFGYDRYLNQKLYTTSEWRKAKRDVIVRDNACDLAHPDHEIFPHGKKKMIFVHHINPITKQDILDRAPCVLDPNNLVTVSFDTHQIIHYGYDLDKPPAVIERKPFDTCPWKV